MKEEEEGTAHTSPEYPANFFLCLLSYDSRSSLIRLDRRKNMNGVHTEAVAKAHMSSTVRTRTLDHAYLQPKHRTTR